MGGEPVRQKGIMAGIGTGGSRRLIGQGQEMDIARENKPWESLRVAAPGVSDGRRAGLRRQPPRLPFVASHRR